MEFLQKENSQVPSIAELQECCDFESSFQAGLRSIKKFLILRFEAYIGNSIDTDSGNSHKN